MKPVTTARGAIDELVTITNWLAANLLPGYVALYRPEISAERRAEVDAAEAQEAAANRRHAVRAEWELVPLGQVPAPLNLDVMDLLSEILSAADEMAETVAVTVNRQALEPASSAFADPNPYLNVIRSHLAAACATDDTLGHWVTAKCQALLFRANHLLGLIMDGQLLTGLCPWCGGRTSKHPVGGARTLRVRLMELDDAKDDDEEPKLVPVVVCEGRMCEVPEKDFGTTWHGRPAWPLDTEGGWLARQIERAAAA